MQWAARRYWILAGLGIIAVGSVIFMTSAQQPMRFAQDRIQPAATKLIEFDGRQAMKYLQDICEIGPRISGREGMLKQQELLKEHFEKHGATVELQKFPAKQRSRRDSIEMANLIARWHPERKKRLLLCAHYDTRPIADQEPNVRRWHEPFLAANDGGSGPAFMMEFCKHLEKLKPALGIDFVLFDGEEYIFDPRPPEVGGDVYFFGSQHFAKTYLDRVRQSADSPQYKEAVLIDMIAGKNARFYYEQYSWAQAGPLVEKIWNYARQTGGDSFIPQVRHAVRDDHLALLQVGISAIDIIDFDYRHWHRLTDTPENCSARPMEQVARVVALWMKEAR